MRAFVFVVAALGLVACGEVEGGGDATDDVTDDAAPVCGDDVENAGEECDDGNTIDGDGCSAACLDEELPLEPHVLNAAWSFRTVDGEVTDCAPGVTTAAVRSQLLDDADEPVGEVVTDLFDCSDGAGVTSALPGGRYLVYIDFGDDDVAPLYGQTLSEIVDLSTADGAFAGELVVNGGYYLLTWDLVRASTGDVVECSQVEGLDGISALSTVAGGVDAFDDIFDCEDHVGLTQPLVTDEYAISVSAINSDGASLGTASTITAAVRDRNRVTNLGLIEIPIDGL